MPQGYYPDEPDSIDDQLDELLCEYVDGTMDPSVKVVFEEYLATNPDLAAHVRCLAETRSMLCRIGECACATATQAQLRVRLASELNRRSHSAIVVRNRLGNVALLTSTVGLLLIFGMMAGITVVQRTFVSGTQESAAEIEVPMTGMDAPTDAHEFIRRSMRLDALQGVSSATIAGPVSSLPVVARPGYMTPMDNSFLVGPSQRNLLQTAVRRIAP